MPDKKKTYPDICDYEGSNYRTEFWEGQGRDYEDRVERVALRRLLPEKGTRLLELGAGFGRLTKEYVGYDQIVLLDYSFSQLQDARQVHGDSGRYIYVAADAYKMPFQSGIFDGVSMIRTIHHMSDVPAVLNQIRRTMAPEGTFILEHANKQNLKAIMRYAIRRQDWSPYDHQPLEFVELNFDFHPEYMRDALKDARFEVEERLPVSFFRVSMFKRALPTNALVTIDSILQWTRLLVTPSIFIRSQAVGTSPDNTRVDNVTALFADPETGMPLKRKGDEMVCERTGTRYAIRDGIYDFKASLD